MRFDRRTIDSYYLLFNSICRIQIIIIDYSKQSLITLEFQKAVLMTY
jgi:hypothetical protein